MLQWLGLDPFTAEGLGSIPGGGPINKNLYSTQRGQKINKMCLLKNFLSVYVCWCIKENSFFFQVVIATAKCLIICFSKRQSLNNTG